MNDTRTNRRRMLWILPPIVVGVLVIMLMGGNRQPPQQVEKETPTRAVRTITVPKVALTPVAQGYGVAQPARVWTAVAQVTGRVIEMHPRLRNGEIISAGSLLFQIDPVDYQLALAQLKAELAELDVQAENTEGLLAIEQRNLSLARRESERLSKLAQKGTSSRSDADTAARTVLTSQTAVENLRNTLALLPTQRRVLEARILQAERDLANTEVKAPFNLRIADLAMETDQYVTAGQTLFQGDDVERVEVVAQVAMSALRHLFVGREIDPQNPAQLTGKLAEFVDLKPTVEMELGGHVARWEAEFVRFSDAVDSDARTLGVVVAVDKPFEKIRPGIRPPLSKGMFVKVLLRGRVQPDRVIVPRTAVRNGKILVIDGRQRLITRPVETLFTQQDIVVVKSGIAAGERLVVSDLIPAVDGMLLLAQPDEALQQRLQRAGEANE